MSFVIKSRGGRVLAKMDNLREAVAEARILRGLVYAVESWGTDPVYMKYPVVDAVSRGAAEVLTIETPAGNAEVEVLATRDFDGFNPAWFEGRINPPKKYAGYTSPWTIQGLFKNARGEYAGNDLRPLHLVWLVRNPAPFTKKGARMMRGIEREGGYGARTPEVAARTVYAAARRGVPGLVKKTWAKAHGYPTSENPATIDAYGYEETYPAERYETVGYLRDLGLSPRFARAVADEMFDVEEQVRRVFPEFDVDEHAAGIVAEVARLSGGRPRELRDVTGGSAVVAEYADLGGEDVHTVLWDRKRRRFFLTPPSEWIWGPGRAT